MDAAARPPAPGRHLAVAAAVLLLDQGSKWLVQRGLPLGDGFALTPFLSLVHAENPGAAFSFLAAAGGWQRWLFTAFGLVAAALIAALLRRPQRALFALALALILGGALGNVADRLLWGHVTDFVDVHLGSAHWPAFNVADSAITVGAALLLLDEWLRPKKAR